MKIKRVKKVRNLGTFSDFQWHNSCKEFERYNFFYGWNYSGKTTLSRIFRCLETKTQHTDFPDAEFILETDNGNITQKDISKDYPIRIFNEDFVADNFKWDNEDAKIEPVLILGEKAKDLENEAKKLLKQKKEKEDEFTKAKQKKKNTEHDLEKSLTNKASEIRNILGITNSKELDKNILENNINRIENTYQSNVLLSDEKENTLKIYRSKKAEKVTFKTPQLKLSVFISGVRDILSQKVTAQKIIRKLARSPKLSDWVREGIDLHQNEKVCQFCGNPLPLDLLERLNEHFSREFDDLIVQINNKEKEISNHIEEIKNLNLPDKARLFDDLQNDYENKLNNLISLKNSYIQILQDLSKELNR